MLENITIKEILSSSSVLIGGLAMVYILYLNHKMDKEEQQNKKHLQPKKIPNNCY